MPGPVKVAVRGDIPAGGKLLAEVDGRAIAVFRIGDDFYAIDDVCTHDGGPLAEGDLLGCEIRCPRHGARFDVRDGRALCLPAIEPVPSHRVEIRGDDVLVEIDD
ncbi:non-heme iron oxygenase ferredoxin subunit [Aquisphaera insulae]|uniref:non-heme iron oxygenase ferredoxin subunit n=1 Tax=Aquisphaera insulae TaxID=2712864 RepID=UPI0013EC6B65|nr:non-heme iron oxygenase ferredoxin subunit [Aquisphaera insulae]